MEKPLGNARQWTATLARLSLGQEGAREGVADRLAEGLQLHALRWEPPQHTA